MDTNREMKDAPESEKHVSRRRFIRSAAAIGGSLLGGSLATHSGSASAQELMARPDRFGVLTDLTRCVGCRRCEVACAQANQLPVPKIPLENESVFETKRRPTTQAFTVVNRYRGPDGKPVYVKVQCSHCEEPACVSACLVGALKKTPEGPVIYNEDVCIGCRYCMVACPFYIPTFEYFDAGSPAIRKCFMCYHRISQGLIPACAQACPVEAITFGKRSELLKIARDRIRKEPDKYIDYIYGEREAGGTGWLYISGAPFEQLGFPTNLDSKPYPEFTREFLSLVPLVLVCWPALFGGFYLLSKSREQTAEAQPPGKVGPS